MKNRFIMCLATLFLLSGCSSLSRYYPGRSTEKAQVTSRQEPKKVAEYYPAPALVIRGDEHAPSEVRLRRRKFIIGEEAIEPGYGAYGYVLLLKEARNDPALRAKYLKICESYIDSFSVFTTSEKTLSSNKRAYFPTFWFLTKPVEENNCTKYVDYYNYLRARKIAEEIGLRFDEAPYLLAEQFHGTTTNKNKRFYISLKRISPDRMDDTFNLWANKITSPSGAWEQGWDLDIIRLQLASFVSTYGDSIYGVMR